MDHYVGTTGPCHQLDDSVTRQTQHLKAKVFFVECDGTFDIACVRMSRFSAKGILVSSISVACWSIRRVGLNLEQAAVMLMHCC